jgi:hypothetical protein
VNIERLVRKPFYVEGVRVTPENMEEVRAWCSGTIKESPASNSRPAAKYIEVAVVRPANPKQCMAFVGNWVLKVGTSFKVYTDTGKQGTFDPLVSAS